MLKLMMKHAKQLASLCAVIALLLFIPAGFAASTPTFVFWVVTIFAFLFIGVAFLFLSHHHADTVRNYFVFENGAHKRTPLSSLTSETVIERVDDFLTPYTDDRLSLWQELPRRLRAQLSENEAFRPLVAYRMLLVLSTAQPSRAWEAFAASELRTVAYVCRALACAGDKAMADYLYSLKQGGATSRTTALSFFAKNKALFTLRMLEFVRRNVHAFDLTDKT